MKQELPSRHVPGRSLLRPGRFTSDGARVCCFCDNPVKPPRRTWCSKQCVEQYFMLTDPGRMRRMVSERDHGVCCKCSMDTEAARAICRDARRVMSWAEWRDFSRWLGIPSGRDCGELWDADHILPVSLGGGQCGLDNLRTLCIWCHRRETSLLRAKLARMERNRLAMEAFVLAQGRRS